MRIHLRALFALSWALVALAAAPAYLITLSRRAPFSALSSLSAYLESKGSIWFSKISVIFCLFISQRVNPG
jgi:hypothetical protein